MWVFKGLLVGCFWALEGGVAGVLQDVLIGSCWWRCWGVTVELQRCFWGVAGCVSRVMLGALLGVLLGRGWGVAGGVVGGVAGVLLAGVAGRCG